MMRKLLTASTAALALAGVTLGAAAPAEARYHGGGYYGRGYYGYHHGGGRTALALSAGILGLAAGAAIVGGNRGYYAPSYGYSSDYYGGGYGSGYGGYSDSGYGGYGRGYSDGGYGYERGPVCRTDWRWDGYARRYARVQYCD